MAEALAKKSGTKLSSKTKAELGEIANMELKLKGISKSVSDLGKRS